MKLKDLVSGMKKKDYFAGNYHGRVLKSVVEEQMHSKNKMTPKNEKRMYKLIGETARRIYKK